MSCSQLCRPRVRRGTRLAEPTGGREQLADRCQPCGRDSQLGVLERARVAPADQTARRQATAATPDVDRTLLERLCQLRNAGLTVDQPDQYPQLNG